MLVSLFSDVNTIEWLHPEEGGPDGAERQLSGNMMSSRSRPTADAEPVDLAATKRPLMCLCMNASGDITRCVLPSRQGVSSLGTTGPAALHCATS